MAENQKNRKKQAIFLLKIGAYVLNSPQKRSFVIFLQWPAFSDFFDTRLLNYIPSGIRICFPLFWGIFFVLGPIPIK